MLISEYFNIVCPYWCRDAQVCPIPIRDVQTHTFTLYHSNFLQQFKAMFSSFESLGAPTTSKIERKGQMLRQPSLKSSVRQRKADRGA